MKKGNVVTICDGSWAQSVVDGKLIHQSLNCDDEQGKHYVVIETDCSFPLAGGKYNYQSNEYRNDTVIQAIGGDRKVVFIHGAFLKSILPKHKIMIDMQCHGHSIIGEVIEISDKLYKEIKRNSQN